VVIARAALQLIALASPATGTFRRRSARLDTESASDGSITTVAEGGSIRIAIAGEHPIFRHGLRRLLEAEPGFAIVGEEADGSRADVLALAVDPDVLLLGAASSGRLFVDTIRALRLSDSRARTILLSDRIDTPEVAAALESGARGVVLKDSAPDVLFSGIRCVVSGRIWLGHGEAPRPAAGLKKLTVARRRSQAFGLTPREVEIVRAVVAGRSDREIAQRAAISENTVKSHLTHIFNKCCASNRVELALFAAHHRLLDGV
jgi:two-component system nitrate/nitrite response regulator NarL